MNEVKAKYWSRNQKWILVIREIVYKIQCVVKGNLPIFFKKKKANQINEVKAETFRENKKKTLF